MSPWRRWTCRRVSGWSCASAASSISARRCRVERDAMVIDGHQHFWDPARADYPWMDAAELAPIRRAFGPADLAPLLHQNGIDASILVQCRGSIEETEEFLRIAATTPFVIGVVGWADLTDGALDETLRR